MTTSAHLLREAQAEERGVEGLDESTLAILERRRKSASARPRGWLVRRLLLLADVVGLSLAFLIAAGLSVAGSPSWGIDVWTEALLFALPLPGWIVVAKLHSLA